LVKGGVQWQTRPRRSFTAFLDWRAVSDALKRLPAISSSETKFPPDVLGGESSFSLKTSKHTCARSPDAAKGNSDGGSRSMNAHLDFLLSALFDAASLHPLHLADLRRSGLTDATISQQKIRTVPPHMIDALLGFPAPCVKSAYVLPFADPRGGWMNHPRLKIFPSLENAARTIKYLQPRCSPARLYLPLATLDAVLTSDAPLWCIEGEKKALAGAQLGLAAIGFCGIEGWHVAGTRSLLPDFDVIPLRERLVELVPDGDAQTNPNVARGAHRLADALAARGARVRLVRLPQGTAS
jgi:hypothetical protein